jgi:hypothetical protein
VPFKLDESLTYLKQIHDIEVLMNNEQSWNALTAVCDCFFFRFLLINIIFRRSVKARLRL